MEASLTLPQTNDEALEWLWRSRYSSDGRTAFCRKCGRTRTHHRVRSRPAWECDSCGAHVHPTAGTLLERTRIPIQTWIRAALLLCTYTELSVRQLQAELGVAYKTAWRLRRLIRTRVPLAGRVTGEITPPIALEIIEAVFAVDKAEDVREAVGHILRRGGRARIRRSALGSGSATVTEPREVVILRAACSALSQRGYTATRMADIATEAHVSLATLYAHFETREDLLLSAIDWANHQGTAQRETIISSGASATAKLAAFLDLAVPSGPVRQEHALYLDLWSRIAGEPKLRPMVVRARARWHNYFRQIIEQGLASGEFRVRCRVDDVVARVVAIQTGLGVETIVGFDWMPDTRARELLIASVAGELGIDPVLLDTSEPATQGIQLTERGAVSSSLGRGTRSGASYWATPGQQDLPKSAEIVVRSEEE